MIYVIRHKTYGRPTCAPRTISGPRSKESGDRTNYSGAMVWRTEQEARCRLRGREEWFCVYGVDADWDADTATDEVVDGNHRLLQRDARIFLLSEATPTEEE